MSVKVIGAGGVGEDAIGVIGDALDELEAEVGELELLEFLAADLDPVPADPAFRQALGEALWALVESGNLPRPRGH